MGANQTPTPAALKVGRKLGGYERAEEYARVIDKATRPLVGALRAMIDGESGCIGDAETALKEWTR